MRGSLRKPCVMYLLVYGVLLALLTATTSGCAQSPEGVGTSPNAASQDRTSAEQTTVTYRDTTSRQQTTDEQAGTTQNTQSGEQVEITVGGQGQPQQQDQQGNLQTVTVRITGTEGLPFDGRIDSSRNLRRVEGSVPQEYEIPFGAAAVTATLRKQETGSRGTLRAEVVRNGEVVASRETSSATGVLNLIWRPQDQDN